MNSELFLKEISGVGVKKHSLRFCFISPLLENSNYRAVRSNQPEDFVVPEMA